MKDPPDTIVQTYRGLVVRMQIFCETTKVASPGFRWGYEVCVDDPQRGVRIWGPLHHGTPYGSREAAAEAGDQRGRLAIDMLLGAI